MNETIGKVSNKARYMCVHARFLKSDPNSSVTLHTLFNFLGLGLLICLFSVDWIVVFQL